MPETRPLAGMALLPPAILTTSRPGTVARVLVLVLAAAAAMRLYGLDWDQGQHLHPDERFLTMVASDLRAPESISAYFDTERSPLNPANSGRGFFVYGTLPLFLVKAVASPFGWDGYDTVHRVGRVCAAIFDVGTIFLTYRLGLLLAGPLAGLGGAALVAFSVTSIQNAHFFTVDSFGAFFSTAVLLTLARVAGGGRLAWHALFGAALAATLASRINLGLVAVLYPLALLHAWRWRQRGVGWLTGAAVLAVAIATLLFRVLQPYAFAGPGFWSLALAPGFVQSLDTIRGFTTGAVDYPPSVQWVGRTPVLFPAWNLLVWGLGPAFGLAAIGGLAWMYVHRPGPEAAERVRVGRLVLLWVPVLFVFHATQFAATIRYFLPIVPLLALSVSSWLLAPCPPGRLRRPAFALVLLLTAAWALSFTSIYTRPHSRVEASRWIYQNVPPGAVIANEHWDDGLPLGIGRETPAAYQRVELRLYDEETEEKRRHLTDTLDAADLVVISSNRLYGSIPRTPWRYPLGRRYYELLFAGELGFTLERVFTSYPSIGSLEIRDDHAEEAFTVFDHPKVLIFRKSPTYDSRRVADLVGAVSLSGIVRVPPRDASALYRRAPPTSLTVGPDEPRASGDSREPGSVGGLLRWLLGVQLLSWGCFGLLLRALGAARDGGYALARLAAWLAPGTLVWWVGSLGLPANTAVVARATAVVIVLAGGIALWRGREELRTLWSARRRTVVALEAVFLAGFGLFLALRAFNPAIFWGEKPMDFAILNACLRSPTFPPADPWFAGERLNYFYFGHALTAVFIRITGVPPAVGFNLAVATLAGLVAVTAAATVLQVSGRVRAGVLGALVVLGAGNLAGVRAFATGSPRIGFDYFWATSRVVPGTINEYPFWNLTFGDLHAHVFAMPLHLGLLLVSATWLTWAAPGARTTLLLAGLSALLLGAVGVTSPWSLPTVAAVQLGVLLTRWLDRGSRSATALAGAVGTWAAILGLGYAAFWPFWAAYAPAARRWGWLSSEFAKLSDVLTVFGVFLALVLPVLAARILVWAGASAARVAAVAGLVAAAAAAGALRSEACAFFAGWTALAAAAWSTPAAAPALRIGALLAACAGGLGVVSETVYVWDRMNTVFKSYLDMWLLLGTGAAMLAWHAWRCAPRAARLLYAGAGGAAVAAGLFTSVTGAAGFLRDPHAPSPVPTLDGTAYLEHLAPSELQSYRWLNQEVRGIPVLLEAHGPPYQAFTRVAMHTGLPTVLGWSYHLLQQARPQDQLDLRAAEVREMYDTTDLARAESLLQRYAVDFVFIGPLERRTYAPAGLRKFANSTRLAQVFANRDVTIFATPGRARTVKSWISPVPPAALVLPAEAPRREPRAIAAAPDGTFVIADFGNRRVQRLTPELRPAAAYGRQGEAPGEYRDPCGIAVGPDGSIWIADTWNHRIQKLSPTGEPLEQVHAGFFGPRGVAVAPDGAVYVTDTGNGRLMRVSGDGEPRVLVQRPELQEPIGITLGSDGEIYVADPGKRRIAVFNREGGLLAAWPVEEWHSGPRIEPALAVGPDGVLWATDPAGGQVLLFAPDGRRLGAGIAADRLEQPLGITLVASDTALVTDAVSGAVVRVRRPGRPGQRSSSRPRNDGERLQTPTRKSPAR